MTTETAGWPRRLGSVLAAALVGFILWTTWSPSGGVASDGTREPTVRGILNRLDEADTFPRSAPVKGDTPTTGSTRGREKITFEIPKSRYLPIGRLAIPAIGLDTSFREGVFDEILIRGPGHWPGTPVPGEVGNSVLSGHRTTYSHPFGNLDLLERGDKVKTTLDHRHTVMYRVFETSIVPEAEYVDFVLDQPGGRRARVLTMFACHPKGYRTHRIVVRARATPRDPKSSEEKM
jgi:LPXTG-site transpeptidase (sortase) family protein